MSSYTEGQAHQLMDRFQAEGFTSLHITKLGQFGNLAGIKNILDGTAKISPVAEDPTRVVSINETTIVVNLAATPKLPFDGAKVEQHIGEGWAVVDKRTDGLYVNGHKISLYLSMRQQNGKYLTGYELHKELNDKLVLNANLLDALRDNSHLIPEEWKKDENGGIRYIFFWATVYHYSDGSLCVRYFCFCDSEWYLGCSRLSNGWPGFCPAVVPAS